MRHVCTVYLLSTYQVTGGQQLHVLPFEDLTKMPKM